MNSSRKRAREGERDGACRSDLMRGGRGGRARRETNTSDLREDIIDTHDAVGAGRAAVVHDGGVALHPHPAAQLGQQTVVLRGDLALRQHCKHKATSVLRGT